MRPRGHAHQTASLPNRRSAPWETQQNARSPAAPNSCDYHLLTSDNAAFAQCLVSPLHPRPPTITKSERAARLTSLPGPLDTGICAASHARFRCAASASRLQEIAPGRPTPEAYRRLVRVVVTRTARGAPNPCRVERSDGVIVEFDMYDHADRLPHDLCHLAVESAIKTRHGFWGCIERGAMFRGMNRVSGKGSGGRATVRRAAPRLDEIERLVAFVTGCWEQGAVPLVGSELGETEGRECAAFLEWCQRAWSDTPIGGSLELRWPLSLPPAL